MNNQKTIQVNSKKVSCDGGDLKSKHPLVYLNIGNNNSISCPYCGTVFTIKLADNITKTT